jgi:two-component system chemotaxis response regulator CheB
MPPIKVLVVDDSSAIRDVISHVLEEDVDIRVIGSAANGREAVAMVTTLQPDLITMDLIMPVMDGFEAIERIMSTRPTPILVITSCQESSSAFKAIETGALEVISKNDLMVGQAKRLVETVKVLSRVRTITHLRGRRYKPFPNCAKDHEDENGIGKVVAIAASTGGPNAISAILSVMPQHFPSPILIAQHIDADFVIDLQMWFNGITPLQVKIARADEKLSGGTVYIAPGGYHLSLGSHGLIALTQKKQGELYVPSCNLLLASAADNYGHNAVGIILSGMSDDGVEGIKAIKQQGGTTIAQDEKTSVVFGMPKMAIESGCIDYIMPVGKIGEALINMIKIK